MSRLACLAALALVFSCGEPGGSDGGSGGGSGGSGGAGGGSALTGLPCEISDIVGKHCVRCHEQPPGAGAPMALVTRADFLAASTLVPQLTNAQRSLVRINSAASPMPPLPYERMTAAEKSAFEAWVNADAPAGACEGHPDAGTAMQPGGTTCATGTFWNRGTLGSIDMNPGLACRSCHLGQNFLNQNPTGVSEPQRAYFFMGTVFPSLHEKDLCNGAPPSGVVEILDSNGVVRQRIGIYAPSGNFFSNSTTAGFPMPYTARVVSNGIAVTMGTPQTNGDCNSCHTEQGLSGAPGRIVWPR